MPRASYTNQRGTSVVELRFCADAVQVSEADCVSELTPDEHEQVITDYFKRVAVALTREPGVSDQRMKAMGRLHRSLLLGQEKLEEETHLGTAEVLHSFFAGRPLPEGHLCTNADGIHEVAKQFFQDFEEQYEQLPAPLRKKCSEIAASHDDATEEDLLLDGICSFVYLGPIEADRAEEIYIEGLNRIESTLRKLKPHFKI